MDETVGWYDILMAKVVNLVAMKTIELTDLVFDMTDGNECVRSTHGEMSTAPAG